MELAIGVMTSHIGKLTVSTCDHSVANIIINLGLMIVPLDQFKGLFFAEMASKQILMEAGK